MSASLPCPNCGAEVFERDEAWWYTDETERCEECGDLLQVEVDEDDEEAWVRNLTDEGWEDS